MVTFAELITEYTQRAGISDSELARSIGVRRQTIFRWKEGLVQRPRNKDDVLACAKKLRLTPEERDTLLIAAGFPPMEPPSLTSTTPSVPPSSHLPNVPLDMPAHGTKPKASTIDSPSAKHDTSDWRQNFSPDTDKSTEHDTEKDSPQDIDNPDTQLDLPSSISSSNEQVGKPDDDLNNKNATNQKNALQKDVDGLNSSQSVYEPATESDAESEADPSAQSAAHPPAPQPQPATQTWQWAIVGVGIVSILIALALIWRLGSENGGQNPIPSMTDTPQSQITPTNSTATNTATPAGVQPVNDPPVPTPTMIVAAEGEILVLVARFVNYTSDQGYNVAGRVQEALQLELETVEGVLANTQVAVMSTVIDNKIAAADVIAQSQASMLVWGEYDSGRVRVNFTMKSIKNDKSIESEWVRLLGSPDELSAVINLEVVEETRTLALLTLGRLYQDLQEYERAQATLIRALENAADTPLLIQNIQQDRNNVAVEATEDESTEEEASEDALNVIKPDGQDASGDERLRSQPLDIFVDDDTLATIYFHLGYVTEKLVTEGEPATYVNVNKAIDYYSQAMMLKPVWVNARYNRGNAYMQRAQLSTDEEAINADLDQAIDDLGKVILANSKKRQAYLNRGISYYIRYKYSDANSDIEAAIADFTKAIELAPAQFRGYYNRGLAYIRSGNPDDEQTWQDDFHKVLELNNDYASAYNGLCWGYALAQQPETALPYCEQAYELSQAGNVHDSFGLIYAQLGKVDKAQEAFEAYLEWLQTQGEGYYERYNGALVDSWVEALVAGENPITADVLEELR
ncbi:MAG: hypothetical protein AAF639_12705 [Chloroflexota bacterium]